MQFDNVFTVEAPIDDAWKLLVDIPKIASCLPGATVHESDGDEFEGSVTVKVGPIKVEYQGTASMAEVDEPAKRFAVEAHGKERAGRGSVAATIAVQLRESGPDSTTVRVATDVDVTGKVAQFGRSAMADVGARLTEQFAANLEATFLGGRQEAPAPEATELDVMTLASPALKRALPSVGAFALGAVVALVLRRLLQRSRPDSSTPVGSG